MAYGRSGSVLVQSLFDGHPNVVTLPHVGPIYSLIPASITDLDQQTDWFIGKFPTIFDTSRGGYFNNLEVVAAKFGPAGDEDLRVSSTEFKSNLLSIVNKYCTTDADRRLSRKEFFILVHMAYGMCVRSLEVTELRYIFYHVHLYVDAEWQFMLEDFPELYLIAMTRDPRQDWASWKKYHASRMERNVSEVPRICLFLSEYKYSQGCYDLSNLIGRLKHDHTRVIDLEELHISGTAALMQLCSWLNIEFNECLLSSTFNGRQWHGNAASGKRASSLNPSMTRDAWCKELANHDRLIIDSLLPGVIRYFGYDRKNPAARGEAGEAAVKDLKYRSDLPLYIDCILYVSGKPIRSFLRSWHGHRINKMRVILRFGATFYRGASLFLQLRGNGLDRKLAQIGVQQNELLRKSLPPRLAL
jgi:hypothetical protein